MLGHSSKIFCFSSPPTPKFSHRFCFLNYCYDILGMQTVLALVSRHISVCVCVCVCVSTRTQKVGMKPHSELNIRYVSHKASQSSQPVAMQLFTQLQNKYLMYAYMDHLMQYSNHEKHIHKNINCLRFRFPETQMCVGLWSSLAMMK